jgi:hypothetical protein
MIADGARDRQVYGMLLDSYLTYSCLYQGELEPELELAAPYLVQLEHDDRYSQRLMERARGNSWGVFLKCGASIGTLRRHLRGLLTVRGPKGDLLLFRFYDPRILRVYLPTCRADELTAVFGPIDCFWVEGEDRDTVIEFRVDQGRLVRKEFTAAKAAASL